jgi:hypothetical protein
LSPKNFFGMLKLVKVASLLIVALMLGALLAACGREEQPPLPSGLETVNAGQTNITPGAATTTAATTSAATALATTAVATTAAPTTVAATTAPAVTVAPLKKSVILEPMSWEVQTWNNCAPMSALMALSFYGVKLKQADCGKALRPNDGDKHVKPEELVGFIRQQGLITMKRENGTLDQLRALLSAGIPVITQQWLKEGDDIGHYRTARGYDMNTDVIIFNDSMDREPKTVIKSGKQDILWKAYDRRFFPVYSAKQEATVQAILGADFDEKTNMTRAMDAATAYANANPKDIDGWRNLGYLNYAMGDCKSALNVWEERIAPNLKKTEQGIYNRYLWYQLWPVECYNKVGNYAKVIEIAPNEIEKSKVFAEMRYEYAVALSNTGRKDEAIAQLKKALLDDQNSKASQELLTKLGA